MQPMPLEASDYERIQQAVDKVSAKLDTVVAGLVARTEYEARHANLSRRVDDHEVLLRDIRSYGYTEISKMREERQRDMDSLRGEFDKQFGALDSKFDEIVKAISENRLVTIRYIISVVISFFLGSGIFGILAVFHVIH